MSIRGIAFEVFVEVALAAQIVVQPDHVRRARIFEEPFQFLFRNSGPSEVVPHTMSAIDSPAKNVVRTPAAFVFEFRLIGESWSAVHLSEIFCLDQAGRGINPADRSHCEHNGAALVQEGTGKGMFITVMRIPAAI